MSGGAQLSDRVYLRRNGRSVHVTMTSLVGLMEDALPAPDVSVAWTDVTGKPSSFPPSTHTHVISDVTGLQTALDSKQAAAAVLTNTTASFTTAQEAKLAGIASGATANASDADLRNRATHTGTQAANTITGLATVATSGAYADLSGRPTLFDGAYSSLSGVPSTFAPSAHNHIIADVTGLQTALDGKQAAGSYAAGAIQTEVETARGSRAQLGDRIGTISNFASPNAGGIIVGNFYDNAFHALNGGTLAGAANRAEMAPFYTSVPMRIDQFGVAVSTAVASSLGRLFIYGSNADGWPDELLYEGDSNLDFATTGYKAHTVDFTFDSGRQYWLGIKHSSTATIRSIATAAAVNLGIQNSTSASYNTVIRRTLTFANALPANWGFLTSDLVAGITPPSFRMRAAAL